MKRLIAYLKGVAPWRRNGSIVFFSLILGSVIPMVLQGALQLPVEVFKYSLCCFFVIGIFWISFLMMKQPSLKPLIAYLKGVAPWRRNGSLFVLACALVSVVLSTLQGALQLPVEVFEYTVYAMFGIGIFWGVIVLAKTPWRR